jgi:putative transposase
MDKHRHSIRLKNYDYSRPGLYFVTICVYDRLYLFGKIINYEMKLNDAGKIAKKCWLEIPGHYPNVVLHEYVIMPNHIHGIIEITKSVGAKNLSPNIVDTFDCNGSGERAKNLSPLRVFRSPSKTIGSIVRGFKIGVTKWFHKNTNIIKLWERGYYEHIIRNNNELKNIREYVKNNPIND